MRVVLAGILSASLALAQLESNTVTVTASRSIYVRPDQALFTVSVPTAPKQTLADVLAGLAPLNVTADQLVSTGSEGPWTFRITTPLANLQQTVSNLVAASAALSLTFSMDGEQPSAQALASQTCSQSDLIADARAQAQKLAAAAGLSLGPITALTNLAAPAPAGFAAAYIAVTGFAGGVLAASAAPLTCSSTVKFALVRY